MTLDFSAPTWLMILSVGGMILFVIAALGLLGTTFYATVRSLTPRKSKGIFLTGFGLMALGLATLPLLVVVQGARAPEVLQAGAQEHYDLRLSKEEAQELLNAEDTRSRAGQDGTPAFRGTAAVAAAEGRLTLMQEGDRWYLLRFDSFEEYKKFD